MIRAKLKALIDRYFIFKEQRPAIRVNRRKYLWLAGLTGWMGGHRFYSKKYPSALLCLLFFWTGVPLVNALVDIMIMLPKEKEMDAEGYVFI